MVMFGLTVGRGRVRSVCSSRRRALEKVISVLVTSEAADVIDSVERLLGDHGFKVVSASSGKEARGLLREESFDLVIVDETMRDTHPAELTRKAGRDERTGEIPILVIVERETSVEWKKAALEAGADDFVTKPLDAVELVARARLLARMKFLSDTVAMVTSPERVMKRELAMLRTPTRRLRRKVTVLFSDIRGFTRFSERTPATRVFDVLNMHLARQAEIVYRHKGIVDKYSGDEVMAFFQGPYMARRAVQCALDIVEGLQEREGEGREDSIRVGVGINTGMVVLGDIGSPRRMTYTAIGDNVNLAARLCGIANYFQILISQSTYAGVKSDPSLEFAKLPPARVKGKQSPVTVYEVKRKEGAKRGPHQR